MKGGALCEGGVSGSSAERYDDSVGVNRVRERENEYLGQHGRLPEEDDSGGELLRFASGDGPVRVHHSLRQLRGQTVSLIAEEGSHPGHIPDAEVG